MKKTEISREKWDSITSTARDPGRTPLREPLHVGTSMGELSTSTREHQ